jgi:hypothetical protein
VDELGDLVEDPDWQHVPEELRRRDGQQVRIEAVDRETGERVVETGALVIFPGDFGDAARKRADDDASA